MYLHPNDDAKYNMKKCSRKYMSESLHQKKGDENTQNLLHWYNIWMWEMFQQSRLHR